MADFIFVDDHETEIPIEAFREAGLDAEVYGPQDLEKPELEARLSAAFVILVDLTLEDWRTAKEGGLTNPANGIDLASIIRSRLERINKRARQHSSAICLYSGDLSMFDAYPPGLYRQHAVSRFLDLEWAFDKVDHIEDVRWQAAQLANLKDAVWSQRELAKAQHGSTRLLLQDFLAITDPPDFVWEDIELSKPPIHESFRASAGLSALRWLLHRILPYPTFLIDEAALALRCRLSRDDFQRQISRSGALRAFWDRNRYSGALSTFLGPRWWKHQVDQDLWNVTEGRPYDPTVLEHALAYNADARETELVLCVDEAFSWVTDALAPISDAMRIAPEDWPAFAEPAWITRALLHDHPALLDLVIEADRSIVA